MTTDLRDWYLSTLGIVQYLPREADTGELPFHVELTAESPAVQAPPIVAIDQIVELLKPSEEKSAAEIPKTIRPLEEGAPLGVEQLAPCRLACWQPCDDLLVLNAYKPDSVPSPDESALLVNLLRAIGRGGDGSLSPEFIDWRISRGELSDLAAAKTMLSVFVDVRIRKRGVLWVLLMGELPAALLLPSQQDYPGAIDAVVELAGGARAIVTPSLQEMLKVQISKRDTWRTIQHACLVLPQ